MDVRSAVAHLLVDVDRYESRRLANRESYLERGYRLVSHDQDGSDLLVRDGISGELLFRGSIEESDAFFDRQEQRLAALDTIDSEVDFDDIPIPGLPASLVDALRTWVDNHEDEARKFAAGH